MGSTGTSHKQWEDEEATLRKWEAEEQIRLWEAQEQARKQWRMTRLLFVNGKQKRHLVEPGKLRKGSAREQEIETSQKEEMH